MCAVCVACSSTDAPSKGNASDDGGPSNHPRAANIGAQATATVEPTSASATGSDAGGLNQPVAGTAKFRVTTAGVDLVLSFTGCTFTHYYAVGLYDAPDCAGAIAHIKSGNFAGRDDIPELTCTGTTGFAHVFYSRASGDPEPWTIADEPAPSNVVGRVLVIRDRDAPFRPLACGKVVRTDSAAVGAALPAVAVSAELIGFCAFNLSLAAGAACQDPEPAVSCTDTHCGLSECVGVCSDHIGCVEGQPDPCATSTSVCGVTDGCASCLTRVRECMYGFCLPALLCSAPPTPGGPCSKVEACCQTQGDFAQQGLDGAHQLERLGGDPNCVSAMTDWDFNAHLPVPCKWD